MRNLYNFFFIIIVLTDVRFFYSEEFNGFLLIGNYFIKMYTEMIKVIINVIGVIIN